MTPRNSTPSLAPRRICAAGVDGVDIHIVDLHLTSRQLAAAVKLLSAGDHRLMAQQTRSSSRSSFAARWAAARVLLGELLDVPPNKVRIRRDRAGRPHLPHDPSLDFNLSHSGDKALIAVASRGARIGVDLERVRDDLEWQAILASAATPDERSRVQADIGQWGLAAFFDFWVAKEAVVKAIGVGLSLPLDLVRLARAHAVVSTTGRRFTLCHLNVAPGFSAAMAIEYARV